MSVRVGQPGGDSGSQSSAPDHVARLLALGDLHVEALENRHYIEQLRPTNEGDWLIVCGDVGELMSDIRWALRTLADRFSKVIWVPGNHELWIRPDDPVRLRGEGRYNHLVRFCQDLGIVTPEDPYPVWTGIGGPAIVAPLFTLYDYSFGRNIGGSKAESLRRAHEAGVVCSDEMVLAPDPYPSVDAWCRHRVGVTERRLTEDPSSLPMVLVDHFPLIEELTSSLFYPEFAQWCGTLQTADWHTRFRAVSVVYGHLHIPRTTYHDGVQFDEVSLGYPNQWKRSGRPAALRPILTERLPSDRWT